MFLEALALPGDVPDHLVHLLDLFDYLRSLRRTVAVLLKDEARDLDVRASRNGRAVDLKLYSVSSYNGLKAKAAGRQAQSRSTLNFSVSA